MRNYQRCRPCGGGNEPIKNCYSEKKCCSEVETVVEPTVYCEVPNRHHHKCVRHIVPIVYHQDHHHHKHHEYEVKRKHTHKHHHHEHGRFNGDWCETDSCGSGLDQGKNESYDNDSFDSGCDNQYDSGYGSEVYM